MKPLSPDKINEWLEDHDIWSVQKDELCAEFTFKDFVQAMGFMVQVGIHAEKQDHHPRLENTYNKVKIALNTHDAGNKITDRDIKLAEQIETINIY